jgi:hypothetical protein
MDYFTLLHVQFEHHSLVSVCLFYLLFAFIVEVTLLLLF